MSTPPSGTAAHFGSFDLLRLLGEGAHGTVWLAQQHDPHRQVALKILRSAGAGTEALSRFRRETELLAMLEHPGIARMYASGSIDTATGATPYLAMEYVNGRTLSDYAQRTQPTLRQRVQMLAELCRTVHYAHTHGIVHRDLKPGNILVDDDGHPHIIDFGVASVLNRDDLTQMTHLGSVLGTFPYMSPEQIGGDSISADPRWDVYALGVIAYELLSGQLPRPGLANQTSVIGAMRLLAAERAAPLGRIYPAASGDLGIVVMKALAEEASSRYGSAAEFGMDLQRWLDGRPIEARRPTLQYTLGLFVRRHRVAAATAAAIATALIAATAISIGFAIREADARRQAELRTAERDAVNGFLTDMLISADPESTGSEGYDITVREWLALADQTYAARSDTLAPEVSLQLGHTLGTALLHLGEVDKASARLNETLQLSRQTYGADASATSRIEIDAARAVADSDPAQVDAQEARLRTLLARAQASGDPQLEATAGLVLSTLLLQLGRADDAVLETVQAVYDRAHEALGKDDTQTISALHNLAVLLKARGEFQRSAALARTVLEQRSAQLGPEHPLTLYSANNLGTVLERLGENDEAEPLYRQTLQARRRALGNNHPSTLATLNNLSGLLIQRGAREEAAPLVDELVRGNRIRFGAEAPRTLLSMNQRAYLLEDLGQLDEAEHQFREVIAIQQQQTTLSPEHLAPRSNLAMLLAKQHRYTDAVQQMRATIADATELLGPKHPYVGIFRSNLGQILLDAGRADEALNALRTADAVLTGSVGADHPRTKINTERLTRAESEAMR